MEFRSTCPLSIILDLVGDKWSLLIIRDIFMGANTYSQFLNSPERIASNILVDRINKLKVHGIIKVVRDKEDGKIKHYYLTEKGIDLYPVLAEMMHWSQKYIEVDFHPSVDGILNEIKSIGVPEHVERYSENYRLKLPKIL